MSMYAELLLGALAERPYLAPEATTGEGLAEVVLCRSRLNAPRPADRRERWASGALADQLAYDAALVRLARHLGVACDVRAFERPPVERLRLEAGLSAAGIVLSDLGGQLRSAPHVG